MMANPKISIIMSVKNGAKDLSKSIGSILQQTFKEWEFIICDDGSTDDTLSRLNEYAAKDERFIILHHDQSTGLAQALNDCIAASHCDILARQDADDYSHPNRLDQQYKFVYEHPEYAVVGTGYYTVDEKCQILKENYPKELPSALDQVKVGLFMHPSWMMRKEKLAQVGYYTANKYTMRSQDYHLVMKILGAGMKLYNMQELLYYYTADSGTIKRSLNWNRVPGLMWIRWDAYRRNHLPLWCYAYVLKPLISNLIPRGIMKRHYQKVYGNTNSSGK